MNDRPVVVQVAMNGKLKINNEDTTWDGPGSPHGADFQGPRRESSFRQGENDVTVHGRRAGPIDIMRGSGIDKVGLYYPRNSKQVSNYQVENAPRRAGREPSVDRFGRALQGC